MARKIMKTNMALCSLILLTLSLNLFSVDGTKINRGIEFGIDANGDHISHRKALISPLYAGTPYQGIVVTLPGVVEAELFDLGGQGIAYNNVEVDVEMPDNVIRLEENGVKVAIQINDVAATANTGASEEDGEMAVGMGMSTEWMRYTINVPIGGTFSPTWRIATWDGVDGPVPVNIKVVIGTGAEDDPCALVGGGTFERAEVNTGGWKVFGSFVGDDIDIEAGNHVLTICLDNILNFEINYINFELVEAAADIPAGDTPAPTMRTMAPTMSTMAPTMSTMAPTVALISSSTAGCPEEGEVCSQTNLCCDGLVCTLAKRCVLVARRKDTSVAENPAHGLAGLFGHIF